MPPCPAHRVGRRLPQPTRESAPRRTGMLKGTPSRFSTHDLLPEPFVTERWYYARDGRRQGPVPRERLADLARGGWLSPDDLVWSTGSPEWLPARSLDWLWGGTITRTVSDLVDAALHPEKSSRGPAPHPLSERPPLIDWEHLAPRHLLATVGAFLAALGIAFTAIAPSCPLYTSDAADETRGVDLGVCTDVQEKIL